MKNSSPSNTPVHKGTVSISAQRRFLLLPIIRQWRHLQSGRPLVKQKTSANRVLVDLIEAGLQAKEAEKERFFALAGKLTESKDPKERKRLREELAVMTFGS